MGFEHTVAACTVLLQAVQFSIVYCFLKTSEHRAAFYNLPRRQKLLVRSSIQYKHDLIALCLIYLDSTIERHIWPPFSAIADIDG
ncbi:hypothetical protein BTV99_00915 [Psychrobacter sp. Rd 27.2]|nr:hypothetical protein BTV99_00915 [Psychrobacter sp. Rd 27.2]